MHRYTPLTEPPQHIKLVVPADVHLDSCQATHRQTDRQTHSGTFLLTPTDIEDKTFGNEHVVTAGV